MHLKLLSKLARRNFRANKHLNVPFILSSSAMFSFFYITFSIVFNDYVQERHKTLPQIIAIGAAIMVLLVFIFVFFANHYVHKQRGKEQALYMVLGLEKRHVRALLFIEQLFNLSIILVLSIVTGQALGSIVFLILGKILNVSDMKIADYPINPLVVIVTAIFITLTLGLNYIISSIKLSVLNPKKLMQSQDEGQRIKKVNYFSFVIGLILVGIGYYLALTTDNFLKAIFRIFIASLIISIGTFFLLRNLVVLVLLLRKKNKKKYYRTNNFISTSGMLYRVNSSGASMSTVAILSTGVIMMIGCCFYLYTGMNNMINSTMPTDYKITIHPYKTISETDIDIDASKTEQVNIDYSEVLASLKTYKERLEKHVNIDYSAIYSSIDVWGKSNEDFTAILRTENMDNYNDFRDFSELLELTFIEETEHNRIYPNENLDLADDEIAIFTEDRRFHGKQSLSILDKSMNVRYLNKRPGHSAFIGSQMYVVMPKNVDINAFVKDFGDVSGNDLYYKAIYWIFNVPDKQERLKLESRINSENYILEGLRDTFYENPNLDSYSFIFSPTSKLEMINFQYELNGGFLFLGILVGLILLIGTALVMYYKQLSEAYQDKRNFAIMKRVGLEEDMIRKTNNQQIFWMFFLPILVAIIHLSVASVILYQLFFLLGIKNLQNYVLLFSLAALIFSIIYWIFYKLTSKVYFGIVNSGELKTA